MRVESSYATPHAKKLCLKFLQQLRLIVPSEETGVLYKVDKCSDSRALFIPGSGLCIPAVPRK